LTRVFPNKFPAVSEFSQIDHHLSAAGGHEVIVESPRHVASFSELTAEEARSAFSVYSARLRHYRERGFASGHLFKNCGLNAGASLEHVHSQLIALHRVPTPVRHRNQRNGRFKERWGESIASMVLRRERRDKVRLITEDDDVVAFAPFASRAPYEMRVLPKREEPCFEDLATERLDSLSAMLLRLTKCLETIIPGASYNVIFHTRSWRRGTTDHWQIELVPRVTRWAGFELATDEYINPVLPESAARRLRETLSTEVAQTTSFAND
jgi:UDPglucose--hexose-1-phosphate uridylyltransferase